MKNIIVFAVVAGLCGCASQSRPTIAERMADHTAAMQAHEERAERTQAAAISDLVAKSHELDVETIKHFKHLKPSDTDSCLGLADEYSIMDSDRRFIALAHCLSAADHRNQGR